MMKEFTVTVTDDPLVIDISEFKEVSSVVCTPDNATYTLEYSCSPRKSNNAPRWVLDTDLTAVSVQKSIEFGKITRLRLTLVSGTSVSIDIV